MPLPRYGVAIGTYVRFQRDPQDNFGRWYHGHLTIATPAGEYQTALDVDTPAAVGVSYRVSRNLSKRVLDPVAGMQSGWHALASNSTSGAIDYVRSGFLQDRLIGWPLERAATTLQRRATGLPSYEWRSWADRGANSVLTTLDRVSARLPLWPLRARPWIRSNGDNALSTLEAELPGSSRIYIFGDHYRTGLGVHDVHMNQGDPAGSQWWATDGIWQDGAVFVEKPSGTLFGWQVKFNSQSMRTDSAGHPV